MDKIPLYGAFRDYVMKAINDVKNASHKKEWPLVILYCVVFLTVIGVFVFGSIATIGAGINQWHSWFPKTIPTPPYPPKTLTYNRLISNHKNELGFYRNLFEVFIHNPPGNTESRVLLTTNLGQKGECTKGSQNANLEITPGLSSTTDRMLVDCSTEKPILDDGNIFNIVKNDSPNTSP